MQIFLANQSKQILGGGFSFINYFSKYADKIITEDYDKSDIFFIPSATMVTREQVAKAKEDNKKIILRCDNIPKNSRNRNTGSSRLYDFASLADLVIYQSEWAREYAGYFVGVDGPVIYNGVDTDIFKKTGTTHNLKNNRRIYLYSRFNRDESKRPDEALYYYHRYWRENKDSQLWLLGNFSRDIVQYQFDLFMNEPMLYLGCLDNKEQIAMYLREADVFLCPYFNDACSNSVIEAMLCGCEIDTCTSGKTGGTPELIKKFKQGFDFSAERMVREYLVEFNNLK